MYAVNELLFPAHAIPSLQDARGPAWQRLVRHVTPLPEDHPEKLAFSLMMIRLNGCIECETDSYRAMRGCLPCALQTLRRYKGPDADLLDIYERALADVNAHFNTLAQKYSGRRLAA